MSGFRPIVRRLFGATPTLFLLCATMVFVGAADSAAQDDSSSGDTAPVCGDEGCFADALPDPGTTGGSFFAFRNGVWYIDANANGAWDGCSTGDRCTTWGIAGDKPVANFPHTMVYRAGNWFGDQNDNGVWDGCATDFCRTFGTALSIPVPGFFAVFEGGRWYFDRGTSGWQGCAIDHCWHFGAPGDIPVIRSGDLGVFRDGVWYLDANGNQAWDGCFIDECSIFGAAGDQPFITPRSLIGVRRGTMTYLDYNNNGDWDGCVIDSCINFGAPGDIGGFIRPV